MSDHSMRFRFSSAVEIDGNDYPDVTNYEVVHAFPADQLDAIYEKFAEFLRASGFDYVRYIGDGMFDKERWRDSRCED